ncbi:MAG: gliding motility protein GldC [Bacteroidota bacterium]|nr:gliding motility protein GldC [Bacteroidota bacterium]
MSSKISEISFQIHLDENNIPSKMEWRATDSSNNEWQENQAVMLSIWDSNEQNALRIDLWTKDMKIDEMNYFFFQTLMTMADTYQTATQNEELARKMKGFAEYFAEKSEVIKGATGHDEHEGHNH